MVWPKVLLKLGDTVKMWFLAIFLKLGDMVKKVILVIIYKTWWYGHGDRWRYGHNKVLVAIRSQKSFRGDRVIFGVMAKKLNYCKTRSRSPHKCLCLHNQP